MNKDWRTGLFAWMTCLQLSVSALAAVPTEPMAKQALPGATLPDLLAWVEQHNPELAAMEQETQAAQERILPAGALDDPMVSTEWRDIPRDNPSLLPGRVGSVKYSLSQAFPLWGKRELKRELASAEADQAQGRLRSLAVELRAKIKTTFAQRYQAIRAAVLTQEQLDLMRDLERLAQTRYANGLAPQQDIIKAQVEQTALHADLISLESEQRQTYARLNSLLGRPASAPLAEPRALPALPKPAELAGLEERSQRASPALFTQTAEITAAERAQRLTIKNRYPDLAAKVSAIQREKQLDAWELMLEVNIPLQQQSRRAKEREAAARLAAAQTRYQAETVRILGDLGEALAGLEAAHRQSELLKNTLVPQSELSFLSALAGYRSGNVDFSTLLEALRQIRRAKLDELKAQVEQRVRLAEIERLVGEDL